MENLVEISKAFNPLKSFGSGTGISRAAQRIPGTASYGNKRFADTLRSAGSDVPNPRLLSNAEQLGFGQPKYGYSARTNRPTRAQRKMDRTVMQAYASPEYKAYQAAKGPRPAGPPGF